MRAIRKSDDYKVYTMNGLSAYGMRVMDLFQQWLRDEYRFETTATPCREDGYVITTPNDIAELLRNFTERLHDTIEVIGQLNIEESNNDA